MILRSEEKLGAGAKFKFLIGLFARKELKFSNSHIFAT